MERIDEGNITNGVSWPLRRYVIASQRSGQEGRNRSSWIRVGQATFRYRQPVPCFGWALRHRVSAVKLQPRTLLTVRKTQRDKTYGYSGLSGNSPGIHRPASVAGNARRSGARGLSDVSTPLSTSEETTRRAWRSPVPTILAASPRGSSPR